MANLCCPKYENNSNKERKCSKKGGINTTNIVNFKKIFQKFYIFVKKSEKLREPQKKIWGLSTI